MNRFFSLLSRVGKGISRPQAATAIPSLGRHISNPSINPRDDDIIQWLKTFEIKIDDKFNTLDTKIDDKFNTLDTRVKTLDTKFDDKFNTLDTQFKTMVKWQRTNEPIFQKAGQVFELIIRDKLRQQYGFTFCESVVVSHLYDLARYSAPTTMLFDLGSRSPQSHVAPDDFLLAKRVTTLARKALEGVPLLEAYLQGPSGKGKQGSPLALKLERDLATFKALPKDQEDARIEFLKSPSPLGLSCIQALSWKLEATGVHDHIEFDVLGTVSSFGNVVEIKVGEIKHSTDVEFAYVQLARRIAVLGCAAQAIINAEAPLAAPGGHAPALLTLKGQVLFPKMGKLSNSKLERLQEKAWAQVITKPEWFKFIYATVIRA